MVFQYGGKLGSVRDICVNHGVSCSIKGTISLISKEDTAILLYAYIISYLKKLSVSMSCKSLVLNRLLPNINQ